MKRLDLTLLLAASLAVPLSASAQETPNALFRVAGLRVTNLLPSVNKVAVVCSTFANGPAISSGSREFRPVPLADVSLGRGVISGPFEVEANSVSSSQVATWWACRLKFFTSTISTEYYSEGCTPANAASRPEFCPKDGASVVTFHQGRY